MNVLITGVTGLIGSAVSARVKAAGHTTIGAVRSGSTFPPMFIDRVISVDMGTITKAGDWEPHLAGVDVVINCVGALQRGPTESPSHVNLTGSTTLFHACEACQIRRIIHLSAIGVDRGALSEFSRTKFAADAVLMSLNLDWIILRPSVVVGRAAFGASALVRGLAAFPILPTMPQTGPLQVVGLDEIVETIVFFLDPLNPGRVVLEIAGPEELAFNDVVADYRRWLGWPPAQYFALPAAIAEAIYGLGDIAGILGWRPAMRTTARREMARGAVGDPTTWQKLTKIRSRSLSEILISEVASVQDRWFSKLYFLKPLIFLTFALFWIGTGLISLGPGWQIGLTLMEEAGAGSLAASGVISGAIADIVTGLAVLYRPTARSGLYGALCLSLFYLIVGTILLPDLWKEPLGPLLKIWPIMALNLVALAILEER